MRFLRPKALLAIALGYLFAMPMSSALAADACTPYLIQAEQYYRMPSGLLRAIAQVESGGQFGYPWVWAINDNGTPRFPRSYGEATSHFAITPMTKPPSATIFAMFGKI
jgi:hypothetical protein